MYIRQITEQSYDPYSQFFLTFSFLVHTFAPPYAIFCIVIVICLHFHHFSHCTILVSDIVLSHLLYCGPTDSQYYSYSLLDELDLLSKNSEIKIYSAELHYFYTNLKYGECDMFCM